MLRHAFALALALSLTAGCNLYFGGDGGGDGDPCDEWGGGGGYDEALGLRNPDTGVCESWGKGGGGGCNECGVCDDLPAADEAAIALPTWGACQSECTGLGEQTCLTTSGCRGIYGVPNDDEGTTPTFQECWQIDQGGQVAGDTCNGLDAWSCSTRDDCSAVHWKSCEEATCPVSGFGSCVDEKVGCYSDQECGAGESCTVEDACMEPPGCDGDSACPDVCYGYCVPDDEPDPGSCYGQPLCPTLPPECPADTVPGLLGGCWSGACIPVDECEPPPSCASLESEASCVDRADCTALYQGVDCTCSADGCSCADWLFESCAADSTR